MTLSLRGGTTLITNFWGSYEDYWNGGHMGDGCYMVKGQVTMSVDKCFAIIMATVIFLWLANPNPC